mmetsp:Transcript_28493/g.66174  ORF Transcript_28493/g.66174 Transcript_28493/m.66174 type:complete len:309 (+) Transcript_28493:253-1179(+)
MHATVASTGRPGVGAEDPTSPTPGLVPRFEPRQRWQSSRAITSLLPVLAPLPPQPPPLVVMTSHLKIPRSLVSSPIGRPYFLRNHPTAATPLSTHPTRTVAPHGSLSAVRRLAAESPRHTRRSHVTTCTRGAHVRTRFDASFAYMRPRLKVLILDATDMSRNLSPICTVTPPRSASSTTVETATALPPVWAARPSWIFLSCGLVRAAAEVIMHSTSPRCAFISSANISTTLSASPMRLFEAMVIMRFLVTGVVLGPSNIFSMASTLASRAMVGLPRKPANALFFVMTSLKPRSSVSTAARLPALDAAV